MPLHIFEQRYRDLVRDCLREERPFGMVYHDWDQQGPFLSEEGRVGCVAAIHEHEALEDGRSLIVARGVERFRIEDGIESDALYFEALVTPYSDQDGVDELALRARRARSVELFRSVVESLSEPPDRLPDFDTSREVSFLLAQMIQVDPAWHQELLELRDEAERLYRLDAVFRAVLG